MALKLKWWNDLKEDFYQGTNYPFKIISIFLIYQPFHKNAPSMQNQSSDKNELIHNQSNISYLLACKEKFSIKLQKYRSTLCNFELRHTEVLSNARSKLDVAGGWFLMFLMVVFTRALSTHTWNIKQTNWVSCQLIQSWAGGKI